MWMEKEKVQRGHLLFNLSLSLINPHKIARWLRSGIPARPGYSYIILREGVLYTFVLKQQNSFCHVISHGALISEKYAWALDFTWAIAPH